MNGVENLETERLILRPWEPKDADFVLDLYSRWEVQRFIGNPPRVMADRAEAEERIRVWRAMDHPVHAVWVVQLKGPAQQANPANSTNPAQPSNPPQQTDPAQPRIPGHSKPALAGTLLLKSIPASGAELPLQPSGDTEIGWHFHPDHWGKGYATEAAAAVLAYAFNNGAPKVVAVTNPANTASQRVCTRIGLLHRGRTSKYYNALCELFELVNPAG
ncbi:Protein N-acetyltransferase, RimJ/RimL family [Pseudarthrobacter enclensis]|uniref:GCN5 family acetyltransferase n=1 Tax=Pseudarthrobacter enclensis TaxID=993070 RepID=A0A0V8IPA5_9MICC|nr:GNAT family N-acetyltransferase [Pseudarthrobacter enclensis]KSU76621.1 GCN5 family acetyltransferase [Pseudarthrobacter enclensis]SCB99947.1 Protein N-acetyltransferase, RimJ/RimL family [Pseudarthrobacter enclensis]